MMRRGILPVLAGLLMVLISSRVRADAPAEAPEFKEVYDLIRAHLAGATQAQMDREAVQALITALAPKVMLVNGDTDSNAVANTPLISKVSLFSGDIAYLRINRVEKGLPDAVHETVQGFMTTNKLQGIVLDLRFTPGRDFAAATGVADLFTSKERALLDWGNGMMRSRAKSDALNLPLAVLVNHQTAGAAEALAAVLRDSGVSLILGGRTAGQAMISEEFPLKNGERLRIATAPMKLGSGATLAAEGVNPDITVRVSAEEERSYLDDAFKTMQGTNMVFTGMNLSLTNQASTTNRTRRSRFNEAELVRERREGAALDGDVSYARNNEPEKPVVRDPALARALDLLKGLAVVRQSRS